MKQRFLFLASILLYFGTSGGSLATPTPKKEVIEPEIISGEICEWEEFKPSCPQGHVVYVRSARYGRMKENRCITGGVGGMGCEANVTQKVAGICTGRGSCVLRVIDLFGFGECHKDYKSYLEVHYTCIRVVTSSTGCPWESSSTSSSSSSSSLSSSSLSSSSHHQIWGMMFTTPNFMYFGDRATDFDSTSKIVGGHYIESSTSGILSSSVAIETGDGTRRCPWMFKLHPPQTLNLTFHQFTDHNFASTVEVTESYKGSSGGRYHGNDGGRGRQTSHQIHVTSGLPSTYVSGKDTVEVVLIFLNSTNYVTNLSDNYDVGSDHHHHHHQLSPPPPPLHRHARRDDRSERHRLQVVMETAAVLIEFRVNGCTPLNHPPNTWSSTDGHVTNVTCNDTGEYFRLTCAGNEWSGRLGNCSEVLSRRRLDGMEFWNEPMQHGILLVVLLGIMIGIAIGFSMLMAVLAYIKKSRQQRRIRGHLANNCRDVTADLSLFDLYDPSDPLTHDLSQSYSHHHHHHQHRHQQHHHHHRELKFSEEEEDTDEEAKTRIYGGSLLEGNVVSMATPVDEINRRNWIWSTWVKRSEVNYGVNCGREGDWDISKTGCEKAASTMTMMMRRMTGRTRKDRADVFSRCPPRRHDNEEMETTDTTVDASDHVTIGTDELASSQLEVDKTGEEINVDTPTNLSAFGGKEFSNNKQQQQLCASNEPSHPLFASLFNSSDDRQVNLDPRSPPQPQNSSLSKSCKASSHMQSAANCNVTNVLHQQHTNNSSCVKPQVVGTPSRNKDGLYGVCFTSDAPYNSLVLNARRQQQQQRQQLQQNFLQYPPYSVLSHNPCCQHHDVLTHRHGNRHDNDIVVGDDDDDDTYDVERGTDDEDNKTDLSPGNLHHHHHHHLQNISSAGIHHRRHHHNQDRHQLNQGLNHYHHRLYNHNHHHHHNFVKPDLVTQTPPPLPVKCIKTNHRCPLCSVNNLSVTSSSSAML